MKHRLPVLCVCCVVFGSIISASAADEWEKTITPFVRGTFGEPRPLSVTYSFGWNGITAATADVRLTKTNGRYRFEANGGTIGLAEKLWKYDSRNIAVSDAETLRPLEVHEVESIGSKRFDAHITYTPERVTSVREERKGSETKSKTRRFEFPNALSLNSALLFLRTQALPDGATYRVVVYPSTSAYLCTLTVVGRERITVPTGSYDAIKLDLQLNKISKKRELLPHKKFRNASVWLSNDADRLVLRIEAKIFIGTVYAELQSARFENEKP